MGSSCSVEGEVSRETHSSSVRSMTVATNQVFIFFLHALHSLLLP